MARVREKKPNLCIRAEKVRKATGKRRPERGKEEKGHQVKNQRKRPRKVKKHRKRKRHYSSLENTTTSSSDTSSLESGENQDEKLVKTERFHVMAQEDFNKYNLIAELAEYANEYCNKFLKKKSSSPSYTGIQSPIAYKGLTNRTVSCEMI